MTKQISIILTLVVLALVASAGFWYVSHTRTTSMSTQAAPVVVPKPVEPVTLTYTDPDYPFSFDYPSFVSWNGQINPLEIAIDKPTRDWGASNKTVTVGKRYPEGNIGGIDFRVQKVPKDFKTWVKKNYPLCVYELTLVDNGYKVVFSDKKYSNPEDFTPCFDREGAHFYSQEGGFLVKAWIGHAPLIENDKDFEQCGNEQCSAIDWIVLSSLRLTK